MEIWSDAEAEEMRRAMDNRDPFRKVCVRVWRLGQWQNWPFTATQLRAGPIQSCVPLRVVNVANIGGYAFVWVSSVMEERESPQVRLKDLSRSVTICF